MKVIKTPFFISVIIEREDYNILYTDGKTIGDDILSRIKSIDKKYRSFNWESKEWKIVNIIEYRKLIEKAENDYQDCMQLRLSLDENGDNDYKKVEL